ncbi:hypothetical protein RD1_3004 [Roseobacter denitrificans OCh 114]|uniref:Uncharacterized protein n=1 Tax=Roseobacter denitrificans (strain ATCC 33942 / OCh 114) TaxID=375451 RepID=Q164S0_ROSDO|nr:hypothetical protein RD1_3004 [Roseobacter denitrificans OCh 114]
MRNLARIEKGATVFCGTLCLLLKSCAQDAGFGLLTGAVFAPGFSGSS